MFIRFAPELALHILEQAEGPLPVASGGEFLENLGEFGEGELVFGSVETSSNAAARRETGELVDEGFDVVAVLSFFDGDGGVSEDEFFGLGAHGDDGGGGGGGGAVEGGETEEVRNFGGKREEVVGR